MDSDNGHTTLLDRVPHVQRIPTSVAAGFYLARSSRAVVIAFPWRKSNHAASRERSRPGASSARGPMRATHYRRYSISSATMTLAHVCSRSSSTLISCSPDPRSRKRSSIGAVCVSHSALRRSRPGPVASRGS